MPNTFSCPTCGAPLTYQDGDGATITCPFCRNSVIVPAELYHAQPEADAHSQLDELLLPQIRDLLARNQKIEAIKLVRQYTDVGLKEAKDAVEEIEAGRRTSLADILTSRPYMPDAASHVPVSTSPSKDGSIVVYLVVAGVFVFLIVLGILLALTNRPPKATPAPIIKTPTLFPTATFVPTPQFASLAATFGSQGIGAGKFSSPNALAIDPEGYLYVGDYDGNRVQVLDPSGKFMVQWTLEPELHIRHLVAGLNGELYANQSGRVFRYDRKTGQQTGEVQYIDPTDGDIDDFDNMAVGLDGSLLVTWINNTLETDTLLRFDPSGKLVQTIANPIQEQTGQFEPHIYLALDGLGNIYALGEYNHTICEYSPQGKLITRFGSKGDKPGQFSNPENIAIDSQGRIFVSEYSKVHVYDASGLYLDSFDIDGGGYVMIFDRQDNLFLLDTYRVMKYVLR